MGPCGPRPTDKSRAGAAGARIKHPKPYLRGPLPAQRDPEGVYLPQMTPCEFDVMYGGQAMLNPLKGFTVFNTSTNAKVVILNLNGVFNVQSSTTYQRRNPSLGLYPTADRCVPRWRGRWLREEEEKAASPQGHHALSS